MRLPININMPYIRKNLLTLLALLVIFCAAVSSMQQQKARWQNHKVLVWDVQEYYMYLPAAFIYNDLDFSYVDALPDSLQERYWKGKSAIGKNIGRLSVGMAITYTPFFLLGHLTAHILDFPANGYSVPYQFFIFISGFVYSFIGYIFLLKVLLKYFSQIATALTLICISLGTNLFYYSTTEGPMSHAVLFCLFAMFLYYTICWYKNPSYKNIIFLFLAAGLAILIRPISIMLVIIFLLYKDDEKNTFGEKISFYLKYYKHFLLGFGILLLIALPQLVYWKMQSGQWIYYSYGNERFFFNDPKIIQGLFSYRKGWLLYTPVMILSLAGFYFLYKRSPKLFFPILIYFILHIYVIFSWWCWWYGGSFGMRAMIEVYAFLALPMAALWQFLWQKQKTVFSAALIFAVACIYLNRRQTLQYRETIIHWDAMNKAYYWSVFNKLTWPDEQTLKLLSPPDYEAAMKGNR
ncbi:MAG: hypothetical protein ACXWDO_05780 [Bacteroidia bacterium]